MISALYTIEVDEHRKIVRLALIGVWDLNTLANFTKAVRSAVTRARAAGVLSNHLRMLIDLRAHGLQPRDVAEQVQDHLAAGTLPGSRNALLVSVSALHKMQAQRVGSAMIDAYFSTSEDEALEWLLASA